MSFKKSIAIFALMMSVGIGSYFMVRERLYPAAVVNLGIITEKEVGRDSLAAYNYFKNNLLVSGTDPTVLDTPEYQVEIRRAALDKLISDSLIYKELSSRFKNDFIDAAERNVGQFISSNENLEMGAKILYGLDLPEFKERILLPQAYREILEGRMFLADEDFENWLTTARSEAKVLIISPIFSWEDGRVVINE
jgi:hypothetical protein